MSDEFKIGLQCKALHGVSGSTATTEIPEVKEATINLTKGEADGTTRGSGGWKLTVSTLLDASVEFEMNWKPGDANFSAIKDSFLNRTPIALAFLDDTDGEGLDADFEVFGFTRNEPLEGIVTVTVMAKPTKTARNPAWKEAGAP